MDFIEAFFNLFSIKLLYKIISKNSITLKNLCKFVEKKSEVFYFGILPSIQVLLQYMQFILYKKNRVFIENALGFVSLVCEKSGNRRII